jgi:hypothetical protein
MSGRSLRVLFLIWLCWYLTGPLFETFDFWDTPQEEMADIASSTAGVLIWAAAAVCVGIWLSRHLCRCCKGLTGLGLNVLLLQSFDLRRYLPPAEPIPLLDTSPLRL